MPSSHLFNNGANMDSYGLQHLLLWSVALMGIIGAMSVPEEERQTYIIHMDQSHKPQFFSTHESWHRFTVASLSSKNGASYEDENFLYSYSHVMHGFSCRLTPSELAEVEKLPAHRATLREAFGKHYTTHTPRFLGLNHHNGLWPAAAYGEDVIIGIIDTGIWPESESFNDRGMSTVPERWKGECESGTEFSSSLCNRKLIGARSFSKGLKAAGINISKEYDYDSARDFFGHGTHTSSTAAGGYVYGADYFGYAKGTARGVAPKAHLAMYKVLWATDSYESAATDVLAGMDQAIADGVDVMSLSLGFDQTPYYDDVIAIGALSAIEKGIFVACAAGNDGSPNSTHNAAPWILTVGAGTVDRSFLASFTLGNGAKFEGTSYYPESVFIAHAPLYYGKGNTTKTGCESLDPEEVSGKVVLCDLSYKSDTISQIEELNRTGAAGGIFVIEKFTLSPEDFSFPGLVLSNATASLVREYAMETTNATVEEMKFQITKLGTKPAPQVAFFSSRGPDPITPSLLKPDILAPGEDVLAAWIPNKPFIQKGDDYLVTDYALLSGTSMASPHAAGVAALLRSVYKDWSPAAIRSAIMTTAILVDNTHSTFKDQWTGLPSTPLDFGAGHINPNKAMDPGLIYDMEFQHYVNFLCSLGYNYTQMAAVTRGDQVACPDSPSELNYPSFMAIFDNTTIYPKVKIFSRVVTNVGDDNSAYRAVFEVPNGMRIHTQPDTLTFTAKYQQQGFQLVVEVDKEAWSENPVTFGYLRWVDQLNHVVSSPVVAMSSGQY